MPQVEIKIGSRAYTVACGAGEEPHLRKAAKLLDAEAQRLAASGQVLPENTVLLMSGLMLADQLMSKEDAGGDDPKIAALEAELKAAKAATEEAQAAAKAAEAQVAEAQAAGAGGEADAASAEQIATLTEERDAARMEVQSLRETLDAAETSGLNGDHAVLERMAVELERLADEIESGTIRAKAS